MSLAGKRRDRLRELLTEMNLEAAASWRTVKKTLDEDQRTPKFADPDQVANCDYTLP